MTSFASKRLPFIDTAPIPGKYWNGSAWQMGYDRGREQLIRRSFTSVRTPGYKSVKRQSLPNNPFEVVTSVRTDHEGDMTLYGSGGKFQRWVGSSRWALPFLWTGLDGVTSFPAAAVSEAQATNRALGMSKDMSVNLAVTFRERQQTVDMLAKSIRRLTNFTIALKRGDVRRALEILGKTVPPRERAKIKAKQFSEAWLEAAFGWRPLVNDVYGAAVAIANTYHRPTLASVQGSGKEQNSKKWTYTEFGITAEFSVEYTTKSRCEFSFVPDVNALKFLTETGLTNPAYTLWETLPYTFVVDWIYPLGNYLSLLDATLGLTFKEGWISSKTEMNARSRVINEGQYVGAGTFGCLEHAVFLGRRKLTSFPTPVLPSLRPPGGLFQIATTLALFVQQFPKIR